MAPKSVSYLIHWRWRRLARQPFPFCALLSRFATIVVTTTAVCSAITFATRPALLSSISFVCSFISSFLLPYELRLSPLVLTVRREFKNYFYSATNRLARYCEQQRPRLAEVTLELRARSHRVKRSAEVVAAHLLPLVHQHETSSQPFISEAPHLCPIESRG